MPEGHTIHRLAIDYWRDFVGHTLAVSSPQGRVVVEAQSLNGDRLQNTDASGKHLFHHWESGRIVHIHLGLYGRFRKHKSPPPEPRGAVRMRVVGDKKAFDLIGPICCELISESKKQTILERLGEDPLRDVSVR